MLLLRLEVVRGGCTVVFWFIDVGGGSFPPGFSCQLRAYLLRKYLSGSMAVRVLANVGACLAVVTLLCTVPADVFSGSLWGGSVLLLGLLATVWRVFWRFRPSSAFISCEAGLSVLAALQGMAWGGGIIPFGEAFPGPEAFLYLLVLVAVATISVLSYAPLPLAMFAFTSGALFLPAMVLVGRSDPVLPLIGLIGIGYGLFLLAGGWARYRELVRQCCIDASHRDVSERLAEHEVRQRSILEHLPELVVVLDSDLKITFHSAASLDLFGYPPGAMQGLDLLAVIAPEDRSRLHCALHGLFLDTDQTFAELVGGLARDGRPIPLSLRGRAIPGVSPERRPRELVLALRDATRRLHTEETLRRARDEAEAAGKARSDFLAMISHEIRTPMSGILGLVDLLSSSDLTTRQNEYVCALQRAGDHLFDLLTGILDFSRIEAKGIEIETEVFDLRRTVGSVADMFRGEAEAKGLQLRVSVSPGLPVAWEGDARCLRQILVNLVGNAIKFTKRGHVEIRIRADEPLSGEKCVLSFDVEDTGVGVSLDYCESIFEPFVQVERELIGKYVGSGLGLAISRRIVMLLGGRIYLSSIIGKGSVFSFTLPLSVASGPMRVKGMVSVRAPCAWEKEAGLMQVLVADDSDLNRLVICEMLRRCGLCVVEATNGAEAVARILSDPGGWKLVFMDIQMPELDGVEAVQRIRAAEQRAGRDPVPIIAVSASARSEDREAAMAAGCCEYIIKPLRQDQLTAALDRFLPGGSDVIRPVPAVQGGVSVFPRRPDRSGSSLSALFPVFLETMRAHVTELRQIVSSGSGTDIARLSHTAKGNAMLFGCTRLVDALRRLEEQGLGCGETALCGDAGQSFMLALVDAVERELRFLEGEAVGYQSEAV